MMLKMLSSTSCLGSGGLSLEEGGLLGLGLLVPHSVALTATVLVLGNNILVAPAELGGEAAKGAVLAARTETLDTECVGDDHALDGVEWLGDTLEALDALEGGGSAVELVGDHVSRGLVVEGTLLGVGVHAFVAFHQELKLVADE